MADILGSLNAAVLLDATVIWVDGDQEISQVIDFVSLTLYLFVLWSEGYLNYFPCFSEPGKYIS